MSSWQVPVYGHQDWVYWSILTALNEYNYIFEMYDMMRHNAVEDCPEMGSLQLYSSIEVHIEFPFDVNNPQIHPTIHGWASADSKPCNPPIQSTICIQISRISVANPINWQPYRGVWKFSLVSGPLSGLCFVVTYIFEVRSLGWWGTRTLADSEFEPLTEWLQE